MNTIYTKCSKCKKEIDVFEQFPNGLCVDCYEKIMDTVPLEKLDKPDFIKAIKT